MLVNLFNNLLRGGGGGGGGVVHFCLGLKIWSPECIYVKAIDFGPKMTKCKLWVKNAYPYMAAGTILDYNSALK